MFGGCQDDCRIVGYFYCLYEEMMLQCPLPLVLATGAEAMGDTLSLD